MNKKFKKAFAAVSALAFAVCISAGSTYAYLTSRTDDVVNTFTVGRVALTLDESAVNKDGEPVDLPRNQGNEYHLIPGRTYTKDPVVHISSESEDCYVFVKVVNPLGDVEASDEEARHRESDDKYVSIAGQMKENGWLPIEGKANFFYRAAAVSAGANIPVFEEFMVNPDATNATLTDKGDIVVKAYAVQKAGFSDALSAWNAQEFA